MNNRDAERIIFNLLAITFREFSFFVQESFVNHVDIIFKPHKIHLFLRYLRRLLIFCLE